MRAFLIALLLCGGAEAFKTPTPKSDPADDLEEIAVEASGAAHLDQLPEGTAVDLSRAAAFLVGEDWATSFFGEGDEDEEDEEDEEDDEDEDGTGHGRELSSRRRFGSVSSSSRRRFTSTARRRAAVSSGSSSSSFSSRRRVLGSSSDFRRRTSGSRVVVGSTYRYGYGYGSSTGFIMGYYMFRSRRRGRIYRDCWECEAAGETDCSFSDNSDSPPAPPPSLEGGGNTTDTCEGSETGEESSASCTAAWEEADQAGKTYQCRRCECDCADSCCRCENYVTEYQAAQDGGAGAVVGSIFSVIFCMTFVGIFVCICVCRRQQMARRAAWVPNTYAGSGGGGYGGGTTVVTTYGGGVQTGGVNVVQTGGAGLYGTQPMVQQSGVPPAYPGSNIAAPVAQPVGGGGPVAMAQPVGQGSSLPMGAVVDQGGTPMATAVAMPVK